MSYIFILLCLICTSYYVFLFFNDKGYHPALCYLWFILPIERYLITLSRAWEHIIMFQRRALRSEH